MWSNPPLGEAEGSSSGTASAWLWYNLMDTGLLGSTWLICPLAVAANLIASGLCPLSQKKPVWVSQLHMKQPRISEALLDALTGPTEQREERDAQLRQSGKVLNSGKLQINSKSLFPSAFPSPEFLLTSGYWRQQLHTEYFQEHCLEK